MIWLVLATLVVVFIVGFRVLTSGTRRAIRRLSERLTITPEPIETLIDQMGRQAGAEFLHYLQRPDESHLQNAAQVLLLWQGIVIDDSEQNVQYWLRVLKRARLATPITEAQGRLALGFLREIGIDKSDIDIFQARYNAFFPPSEDGIIWLH